MAVILTDGEKRAIVVKDLAANKAILRVSAGDAKIRRLGWADDRQLLVVATATDRPMGLSGGKREWASAFLLDVSTQKVRPLLRDAAQGMSNIFDVPIVRTFRGEPALFVQGIRFIGGRGVLSLYRVDLDNGASRLVETGGEDTRDWIVGPDGAAIGQETYDAKSGRWALLLKSGMTWREAASATAKLDRPYVLGAGRDGRSVVYAGPDAAGDWVWREVASDGATGQPITLPDDTRPIWHPADGRLIGHADLIGEELRYTFFDPEDARVWNAVAAAFPGQSVELVNWSHDRRKIVVLADSPTEGPAYALVDLETRSSSWIGPLYTQLKPEDIGPKTAIRFKAADGLELSGYLTLPRGRDPKKLPLVVFPHGGPAARDTPGFDWWAQGMASRGYAVLQVNFRGSDGLGPELLKAGYGQWGRKMQTDLSDGVRHLVAQGIVDPARVCIVGASYGGYAALAAATLDHGVYRCAVSVAGVADLKRQVDYSRQRGGVASERYWHRFMGIEEGQEAAVDAWSPARQADKADIPVLLIHGKDDTVVPLEQSQLMATALGKAGKFYELVVQDGADHWLSRGPTRLQTLQATVAFLEKHNPPN